MKHIIIVFLVTISFAVADDLYPLILNGKVCYMDANGEIAVSPEGNYNTINTEFDKDYDTEFIKSYFHFGNIKFKEYILPNYAYYNEQFITAEHKHWFWFIFLNTYTTYSVINISENTQKDFGDTLVFNFINDIAIFEFKEKEFGTVINRKYGFINDEFDVIIPAKYDFADIFSEGLALVRQNRKYGYIDKNGKEIIPIKYDDAGQFANGLAPVKKDGKWGYINKNDIFEIKPEFELAWKFSDGAALVYKNERFRYIKTDATYLNNETYKKAHTFSEGLAKVKIQDKYGFINTDGELQIKPDMIACYNAQSGMIGYRDGRYWGYKNLNGEIIIKPKFDYIRSFNGELALAWKDGEQVYINKKGEVISKFKKNTINFFRRLFD